MKEAALAADVAKGAKDQRGAVAALQALAAANLRFGSSGGPRKAAQAAEEALALARALGDAKEESEALLKLSKVRLAKQEFETAYSQCEQAVAAAQRSGCRRTQALVQREMAALLLVARAEMETAVEAVEEAIRLSSEIGDASGEIAARHVAASLYIQDDRLLDAMETAEAALALARELKDRRQIKEAVDLVVQLRAGDGQTESALEAAQEELDLVTAGDTSDPRRELAALQRLVSLQLTNEDVEAATKTAEKALQLEFGDDKKVEGFAMQLMAEVHLNARRYEQALASATKAQRLLQGEGDIRAVSNVLQLIFDLHAETGNESEALRSRHSLRLVYQAAGWRDEEATVLLGLSEMILQVRGPREALKPAKEAVAIFQDIGDKSGEASGMLVVAQCQVAQKAATDALRSTVSARRLFQSLFDAAGEAQCLLVAAEVYTRNGAWDEAARVAREAQKICQKGGETKAEGDCLEVLVQLRISVLQKEEESGRRHKPADIEQAVSAVSELIQILDQLPETEERRIMCLSQLSALKLLAQDNEGALKCADEALKLAVVLDRPLPMGQALVCLSEAHHGLGQVRDAVQAAEDAVSLFEQLGDPGLLENAKLAVEQAKRPLPERPPNTGTSSSSSAPAPSPADSVKRPRGGPSSAEFVHREMPHLHGQPPGGASSSSSQAPGPRRGFSSAVGLDGEPGRHAGQPSSMRPPSPTRRDEPNQERRRQQLLAAMEARAAPKVPEFNDSRTTSQLRLILKHVRPDWTSSELAIVQEKFSAIKVDTADELFKQLNALGSRGFNQKLKDADRRPLKKETLDAIREYGDRERSEALRGLDPAA